ncbi:MAG: heme A synthase [Alphaproteobacteria bacterium]|nr:MAG: heme A synthase [Alphaproteobacteria bacterium]
MRDSPSRRAHARQKDPPVTFEQAPQTAKSVIVWLVVMIIMIFAMVVIGGVTRLTQSGLSMVDWRPLMGVVPPLSAAEWQAAFAAYKAYPEYQVLNYGMTLGDFKAIFAMEYAHRMWGRLIGVVFIVPYLWFMVRGSVRGGLALRLGGLLVLGAAQGVMGWVMVKSGLVDDPSVSPYRLAVHLALAVALAAILLWMVLNRTSAPAPITGAAAKRVAGALHTALLLAAATLVSGAFVAGLDAGMSFNTFPLMDGRLVPEGLLALEPVWRNPFENVVMVQFDHRVLGILTMAAVLWLWLRGRRAALGRRARLAVNLAAVAALVQPGLGIATLLLVVPVGLAAAHQAGALVLLGLLVWILHELKRPRGRLD